MRAQLILGSPNLSLKTLQLFVFQRAEFQQVTIDPQSLERARKSHLQLLALLEQRLPLYGVTTGFGDSYARFVRPEQSEQLQKNLVSYLLCGSGSLLSPEMSRAAFATRLHSLSRGLSGVSERLLDRMRLYLENDWIPLIPCEGSLGASGDLIPLAYIAAALMGQGQCWQQGKIVETSELLKNQGLEGLSLGPKEGLALVNGTSAMVGVSLVNLRKMNYLFELATLCTSWTVLVLQGRTEAYDRLVNVDASQHRGQQMAADMILADLKEQNYSAIPLKNLRIEGNDIKGFVQDKYSLRCVPQILGPIHETLALAERWIEEELNSSSDNPIVNEEGDLANGGNFYGGYLCHAMDYLKVSLTHLADLSDRQILLIMDEKSNRGLPPNLAPWNQLPLDNRCLYHGLKALHQSASALTSEIAALAIPNGIFSRSSENHNQDKVSLGMSASMQLNQMLEKAFTLFSIQLLCLSQALDLRSIQLQPGRGLSTYQKVRRHQKFVDTDTRLDHSLKSLREELLLDALEKGRL